MYQRILIPVDGSDCSVKAVVERDHDLTVTGTHGRRGFDRLMLGSVAEGVLRRATEPQLLIRSAATSRSEAGDGPVASPPQGITATACRCGSPR